MDTPAILPPSTADSAGPAVPAGPEGNGLHRRLWVVLLFATAISVAFVLLQAPFVRIERFIMEKDQMNLLYLALIGRPEGYSIGVTEMKTLPIFQYFYTFFFLFSARLTALLWLVLGLKLTAIVGLYALLRRHLPPWTAELLALLFVFDAHRHWDYWAAFLPNTHVEPFALGLLLLAALFHWKGRFAAFHGANVLVCLLMNFHFVNAILVLVPAIVGWKNRARFDRRQLLTSFTPYLLLGLLYLPQVRAIPSLFHPSEAVAAAPMTLETIWTAAAIFFADQTFLGLLGLFGLGFGIRRARRARPGSSLLDGLVIASMATLLALAVAYGLVGDILVGEVAYRCRAFIPAIVILHFLVLYEVVSWARRPAWRTLLVTGSAALSLLHAFSPPLEAREEEDPRPWTWAVTHGDVYSVAAGTRLASRLVAETGASVSDLGRSVHLLPIAHDLRFFVEAASRERGDEARAAPTAPGNQWVVEIVSFDLEHRLHPVKPCLEALEVGRTWQVSSECAARDSEDRYLYGLVPRDAVAETRVKMGAETIGLLPAPEIRYDFWDGEKVLRSREPVLFSGRAGTLLTLEVPEGTKVREFFESPVLLGDGLPPPRTG